MKKYDKILKYYEDIKRINVRLSTRGKDVFSFASEKSIHSSVTDWAYGVPLKRQCADISDGKEIGGTVNVTDNNRRYFLKIIACMPDWQKYVLPLNVKINDETVYENAETFFEQVNLGWPALYIAVPFGVLKKGGNTVRLKAGGKLYLSELSLISYPKPRDLTQVSVKKHVKKGDRFAVAVVDGQGVFVKAERLRNCEFISASYYKKLCILSFVASDIGKLGCTAVFGKKKLILNMPDAVENDDVFLIGTDSDDHRQDDSDETSFIIETVVLSDMGNFIQFRPQIFRNYYRLIDKKACAELINLMDAFGMKYGLCDRNGVMPEIPDIKPDAFFGYHIHEPYLFYNAAILDDQFEKERFLCDPKKINSSGSFGESKKIYMDVLQRSKKMFSKDKGLTSFGSPSLLCVYEGESGVDRITIEPVSNLNLLTGAVRTTGVKMWGAHIPTDWYFGVPVDIVKSNKYRLAMQYLYINGASYLYPENSLFKTNAFERCDWESDFCVTNRKYQREFYDYSLTHPRKGKLIVDKAIIYGRHEFFMWKLNDRIAELKAKDWDSYVWGKWDNAYHIVWNASEAWLPVSDKQNEIESPLNKNLFSGTPYGNVDIVSAEKDFSKYAQIVFLGWNTMDDGLLEKLKDYVYNGGTLAISYCHFNYTDRNDVDAVFPRAEKLKEFLGVDIFGETTVSGKVDFSDESVEVSGVKAVKCNALTATSIATDKKGDGVVYKNVYGKGTVYFTAFKDYITDEKDVELYEKVMRTIGETGDERCDNNNVSYAVRETENEYRISVLNMNCIEGADEKFTIEYKGRKISDEIKVGEIREYVLNR